MGWEEEVAKVVLAAAGAAVIALIGYVVFKKITSSNIVECIKKAVAHAKDSAVNWLVNKNVRGVIKSMSDNAVTISLSDLDGDSDRAAEVTLKSVMGVDASSLGVGMYLICK